MQATVNVLHKSRYIHERIAVQDRSIISRIDWALDLQTQAALYTEST